jgi:glycine/D-amino acid oxidase-like deaminating enzyme
MIGVATAYHLARAGVDQVMLVERHGLSQGTTPAGAGFICAFAAGNVPAWKEEEIALERYALEFYRDLAARGHDINLHANGNLWIASSAEAYEEYIVPLEQHEAVPDKRVLSPRDVAQLLPIVDSAEIVGGVYHPNSLYLTTTLAARALATEAQALGAEIRPYCPVDELIVEHGRVAGVRTPSGELRASNVVLALGAWTNSLLRRHDIWIPLAPVTATRIITEPLGLPATLPSFLIPEMHQLWIREQAGGLLFGADYEARPHYDFLDTDPPDTFSELPLDGYEEMRRLVAQAARLVPVLGQFKSATVATGAPVMTADFRPVAGQVPGLPGAWVITGDLECGITHGPGLAQTVAELLVGEQPTLADAAVLDPGRFDPGLKTGTDVLQAMAATEGGVWKITGEAAPLETV